MSNAGKLEAEIVGKKSSKAWEAGLATFTARVAVGVGEAYTEDLPDVDAVIGEVTRHGWRMAFMSQSTTTRLFGTISIITIVFAR